MSYRQITSDERYMIGRLRQHRFNQRRDRQHPRPAPEFHLRRVPPQLFRRRRALSSLHRGRARSRPADPVAAEQPVHLEGLAPG